MTALTVIERLLASALLAGLIGYERERVGRAAGFRTHILVGVGACLVMLTGLYLREQFPDPSSFDPTRMAAQVISGIGFLGAGTILRFRASVRGLTTAASLWAVAGIGIAMGAGFISGGVITVGVVVLALVVLSRVERKMHKGWTSTLVVQARMSHGELERVQKILDDYDTEIQNFQILPGTHAENSSISFQVKLFSGEIQEEIIRELLRVEGITQARWE